MKKIVVIIIAFIVSLPLLAQMQQGYVKTKGRLASNGTRIAGTRLSGATVSIRGGNTVTSGSNGTFSLSLSNSSYYLQNVQKQGYVLIDPDVLSRQYAYSKNPVVLVMEAPGKQADDRLALERKIRRKLEDQLRQKEDEIESLKEQHIVSEEEYRRQLQEIYAQQENNKKLISEMAERYSTIDFDEVDEFNLRISNLILNGKLAEADSLLNTKGDIHVRAAQLRQHQEANAQAEEKLKISQKKLEKSKVQTQRELEDLARDCYSKFEIFKIQHQNDSAAYYIEYRASLDTTNVEWGLDAGKFFEKYMARYTDAEQLFTRCINVLLLKDSMNSSSVAECYEALASLYSSEGKLDEALKYYENGYNICRTLFGEYHSSVVSSIANIANIYRKKGEYEKSVELLNRAISVTENIKDFSLVNKAKLLGNVGNLYNSKNQHSKALDYYYKAITILDSCKSAFPMEVITAYANIGHTYYELGNYEIALEWDNKAYELIKNVLGDSHPEMATILSNIGGVYLKQKQLEKSLENMEKSVEIDILTYGRQSPKLIIDYNNIGMVQYTAGLYEDALTYYDKALELCSKHLPNNHPFVAVIYSNKGNSCIEISGQEDSALDYFNKALKLRIDKFGEKNSSVAMVYGNMAKAYLKKGNKEMAKFCYVKAIEIFKETLGADHPNTISVQKALDKMK